jgi:hypothetical protein
LDSFHHSQLYYVEYEVDEPTRRGTQVSRRGNPHVCGKGRMPAITTLEIHWEMARYHSLFMGDCLFDKFTSAVIKNSQINGQGPKYDEILVWDVEENILTAKRPWGLWRPWGH